MGDVPIMNGKPVAVGIPRDPSAVAFFVDIDNTDMSPDNLTEIISILKTKGRLVLGKVYGYGDDKVNEFEEIVTQYHLETVGKMRFKGSETSVVDTRLVVDCMKLTEQHKYSTVFVWAGVGDMISLFSKLKELGVKVLTIDNKRFDCDNRFVDEKIRLFSPYSVKKAESPKAKSAPKPPAPPKPDIKAEVISLDGQPIPVLPRKIGAPEFGAAPVNSSPAAKVAEPEKIAEQPDEFSEEENEEIFNRLLEFYGNYAEEIKEEEVKSKPKAFDDFGDLRGSSKSEDDYFSLSPTPKPITTAPPVPSFMASSPSPAPRPLAPTFAPASPPPVAPSAFARPTTAPKPSIFSSAPSAPAPIKPTFSVPPRIPVAPTLSSPKTITITAPSVAGLPTLKPIPVIPIAKKAIPTVTISAAPPARPLPSVAMGPAPSPFVTVGNGANDVDDVRPKTADFNYSSEEEKETAKTLSTLTDFSPFTSFEDPNNPLPPK